jgi:hypothetical protein
VLPFSHGLGLHTSWLCFPAAAFLCCWAFVLPKRFLLLRAAAMILCCYLPPDSRAIFQQGRFQSWPHQPTTDLTKHISSSFTVYGKDSFSKTPALERGKARLCIGPAIRATHPKLTYNVCILVHHCQHSDHPPLEAASCLPPKGLSVHCSNTKRKKF